MKLLVCLKQILDPEISPRDFRVDSERLVAVQGSARLVTNIFCENALETALQLREASGGEITVMTFGSDDAEDTLRKALALRVDHACHVVDSDVPHGSAGAAQVLAAAVKKLGHFDLILLGREAGDWGEGQTAGLLAERLSLSFVSLVDHIDAEGGSVRLRRQSDFGLEELTAPLPAVVSITNTDTNVPRIPKTRDIMLAHRQEFIRWTLDDVGLDAETVRETSCATEVVELSVPESSSRCEFIQGESIDERIRRFATRIVEVLRSV